MIYNGSEFAVFLLYYNRTITQTQQIKMHILNQVDVYVFRTYFYVYHYAYVLLRDQLSTFNTQ